MKSRISHLISILTIMILAGCSPKSDSGVLSFFFDGVPKPSAKENTENTGNTETIHKPDTTLLAAVSDSLAGPSMIIHKPYFNRQCESCHDNSGTSSRTAESQTGICYKCHKDFQEKYSNQHGPVAAGYCTACHAPHESENKDLLKRKGQAMCLLCHSEDQVKKNKAHTTISDQDCTQCHNPHGGSNSYFLQ